MTRSPERSGAAPWYCSHESSRAAASTMVAAGLVTAAALLALVGLLLAGDEVSALVAAMVMLVAGANTWSAGRSRTWWRAVSAAPAAPVAPRAASAVPEAPAPRSAPYPRAAGPAAPVEAPAPRTPALAPVVVRMSTVTPAPAAPAPAPALPAPAPAARTEAADTVELLRAHRAARHAAPEAPAPPAPEDRAATPEGDLPGSRATPPRPGRTASASAGRTRRRTVPVRPVTRRVAGTRSS
jgi:hypothetical protein